MDEDRINDAIAQLQNGDPREAVLDRLLAYGHSEEEASAIVAEAQRRSGTAESKTEQVPQSNEGLIAFSMLVRESFEQAKQRLKLAAAIFGIFAGLTVAAMLCMFALVAVGAMVRTESATGIVVLSVLGLIVFVALTLSYIAAGSAIVKVAVDREMQPSYLGAIAWAFQHIWPLVIIGLLIQLTTATGYAFLVLPGIALAIYTAFSYFSFIKEEKRGITALLRSIDLVYGNFWGVFGRMLGFGFLVALLIAVPGVLLGFLAETMPVLGAVLIVVFFAAAYPFVIVWLVFAMTLLFESLCDLKPLERFDAAQYSTVRTLLIIAAVLGVPILIGWNAFSVYMDMQSDGTPEEMEELPFDLNIQ